MRTVTLRLGTLSSSTRWSRAQSSTSGQSVRRTSLLEISSQRAISWSVRCWATLRIAVRALLTSSCEASYQPGCAVGSSRACCERSIAFYVTELPSTGVKVVIVFDAITSAQSEAQRESLSELVDVVFSAGGAYGLPRLL